ncbi:MAG: ATPase, T2SS/T4P/T4SS family [Planctomycetota bacterium]|jgi:pilus assembly protein CpaF
MFSLKVTDHQTGKAQRFPLKAQVIGIGNLPENQLVLTQVGVSRKHCELRWVNKEWRVLDLGSRNGTYIDGHRVNGEMPIHAGQTIKINEYSLELEQQATAAQPAVAQPAAAPAPAPAPAPALAPAPVAAAQAQSARQVIPPELKKEVHSQLLEMMDLKHTDMTNTGDDELYTHTAKACQEIVAKMGGQIPSWISSATLVKEVVDEAVRLGPLEDLLADESISEIMVVGWDKIFIEQRGKVTLANQQFTDDAQVINVMRRILAPIGRRIDETTPMQDGRLADGSRVNAVIPPLALTGPTLTIRKFAKNPFKVQDLIGFGSMTPQMAAFLDLAVCNRMNIVISGGTGSGKTTLLNVVSNYIPEGERIVTVEDSAELQLKQQHWVRLESRPPNLEGRNAVAIRDLVKNCLRMRPDRIVVGECRGGEALDMLQAMNTGHDGSLTTLHANTPRDAISRLETLVLMAGVDLPSRAIREQIASAVDIIVQATRLTDGSRKVINITAVAGMEGDIISLQDIFRYDQKGFDGEGKVVGEFESTGMIPDFVHDLRNRGIEVDLSMFGGAPT